MCGFGIDLIFKVAIFIIVVLVVLALLRAAFGSWFVNITAAPYWNIIQIVIGGIIALAGDTVYLEAGAVFRADQRPCRRR